MDLLIIFILLSMIIPAAGQAALENARQALISRIERQRKSRLIVLIHRQEVMKLLGFPLARFINIEDSERILRAIHLTPPEMPIDLIVHTPGGLVIAAQQIARALTRHKAKVTIFVPHYAMSGGTMIALASDEIVMDENAVLGPIDPQIGTTPAVSLLKLLKEKQTSKLSDESIILADIAKKSIHQMEQLLISVLSDHVPAVKVKPEDIPKIANSLVSGVWTHDHPITFEDARDLGLQVSTGIPEDVYNLLELYPQASAAEQNVQFIPHPYKFAEQTPASVPPATIVAHRADRESI